MKKSKVSIEKNEIISLERNKKSKKCHKNPYKKHLKKNYR